MDEKGSEKTKTPMITAVIGSKAPKTDVSVDPILLTASTNVIIDTMVGISASNVMLRTQDTSFTGNHWNEPVNKQNRRR